MSLLRLQRKQSGWQPSSCGWKQHPPPPGVSGLREEIYDIWDHGILADGGDQKGRQPAELWPEQDSQQYAAGLWKTLRAVGKTGGDDQWDWTEPAKPIGSRNSHRTCRGTGYGEAAGGRRGRLCPLCFCVPSVQGHPNLYGWVEKVVGGEIVVITSDLRRA